MMDQISQKERSRREEQRAASRADGLRLNELPISRSHAYNLIKAGKLIAKKVGRSTVVTNWSEYLSDQPELSRAA